MANENGVGVAEISPIAAQNIKRAVITECIDWKTTELMHTLDALIELESTKRRQRSFKIVRSTMARQLRDRMGAEAFDGMYDSSVLTVE